MSPLNKAFRKPRSHKKTKPYHSHSVQDVSITIGHDAHRDEETSEEKEENEGSIIGVFGSPVERAAQLMDLQRVAVPPQQRSTGPG